MIGAGFFFLLGLIAGAALVWWRASADFGKRLERNLERNVESTLPRIAEAVLAGKAQQLERDTVREVKSSQAGMEATLDAMRQKIDEYQKQIHTFETEGAATQARVAHQLEVVAAAGAAMTQESRTLREALTHSGSVRGRWGEQTVLKNILDACGLNENIDYHLQVTVTQGDARLRPDAVIHLANGRNLAVDAKASLAAFLEGLEDSDEKQRLASYARFAQVLRARAKDLASREYSRYLDDSLPCVVMFVPSEGAFRAAVDADPDLWRFAQTQSPAVLLASPSTLFPMISIVAHGWQQHRASQQMKSLLEEVSEFGKRLGTFYGHVQSIGKGLDSAGKAYNAALASHRARLAPRLERLQELNAGWEEPAELKALEHPPLLAEAAAAAGDAE
ncbi:MAG TPA: DNA recombination protein RmuC [Terriglobales bacterium]